MPCGGGAVVHQAEPASLLALGARARNKMAHAHSGKPWLRNVRGSNGVTAGDSSVGRASDCRALQLSDGPWFDSGSPDVFHSMLTLLLQRMMTVLDDVIGSRIHAHVSRMVAKRCVQVCQTGPLRALTSQTARESQQYPLASVSVCMPHSVRSSSWGQALDTMARFAGGRPGTDLRLQLPTRTRWRTLQASQEGRPGKLSYFSSFQGLLRKVQRNREEPTRYSNRENSSEHVFIFLRCARHLRTGVSAVTNMPRGTRAQQAMRGSSTASLACRGPRLR